MSDGGVQICYRGHIKEFYFSHITKPEIMELLVMKAFRIRDRLDGFVTKKKYLIPVASLNAYLAKSQERYFELKTLNDQSNTPTNNNNKSEDTSSNHDASRSQSKRNLSKSAGRKAPPQQSQLIQQKFYIEDFQLFVSQVQAKKTKKVFGILFFDNERNAHFLGKKILRQLIYEFGSTIQFYYSVHPIMSRGHNVLLGPVLLFNILHGKHLLMERKFPENLSAIEEISYLLKYLINSGQLKKKIREKKQQLVKVPSYRSMNQRVDEPFLPQDELQMSYHKVNNHGSPSLTPLKATTSNPRPLDNNNTHHDEFGFLQHAPVVRQSKSEINNASFTINNQEEEQMGGLMADQEPEAVVDNQNNLNEISFQNTDEIEYPDWFVNGNALSQFQKGMVAHLISKKDPGFIKIFNSLELEKPQRQQLNEQLIKLLCKDSLDKLIFKHLTPQEISNIENNKSNRKNIIYSILLRFQKLGDVDTCLQSLKKQLETVFNKPQQTQTTGVSYFDIANRINSGTSLLKLRAVDTSSHQHEQVQNEETLPSKMPDLTDRVNLIADTFHYSDNRFILSPKDTQKYKTFMSVNNFTKPEIDKVMDLYRSGDPFIVQQLNGNAHTPELAAEIKSHITSNRYETELLRELQSPSLHRTKRKIQKFSTFKSLVTFLFKDKRISKKQEKLLFYLYIWEDMNVLGAFEVYLETRDLDDFIEAVYLVDQIYSVRRKYDMELTEIEKFNDVLEHQLSILFTHRDEIPLENRLALEKLVRAGDTTIIKMYREAAGLKKNNFITKLNEYADTKRLQLQQIEKIRKQRQTKEKVDKQRRFEFLTQIFPVHFKKLTKQELVFDCLELDEPRLMGIFEVYDATSDTINWIDDFKLYIERIDLIHCQLIITRALETLPGNQRDKDIIKKQAKQNSSLIRGIYQVFQITKDPEELEDSLKRILTKLQK